MKRSILELSRPRLLPLVLLMTSLPHPMCTGLSYCVSPRGLDDSYQGQECKNFSEYLQNASFYFQSNSIFYFVNGTHFVDLNGTLLIQNATNISLAGVGGFKQTMHPIMGAFSESLSKVVFISSSLLFENIENLTIINITFTENGSRVGQMDSPNVAILRLYDVKNVLIARSLFSNISGASINCIGSVAVVMDSYFLDSSTALEAHEASMIGCDHCTIVGSKCAVNFTDSTFSAEQSTIAYCTNGVVSYAALSYMYVTSLSLNECNFLACTDAVSLIDIGLATVVQCAFINCTVGVDAVHIYDQISLYQCNFLSTGYPLVATTISNLIVEQCTFTDAITGVNASDSSAQLWQCSFTSCANGLIAYAPNVYSIIEIMDCNFTTCSTGLTIDLINIAIIGRCAMSHVNYSIAAHGSLVVVVQSVFTAYISAGMFVSSEIVIESCTFTMGKSSTIYSVESYILLHDSVSFSNGYSSGYGGAMYLSGSSVLFEAPVNVSFINNTAQLSGGAIYVEYQHSQTYCFFRIYDPDGTLETPNIHLLFSGNSAREAGNDMYASLKCPIESSGIPLYHSEKQTSESIVRAVSSPALDLAADPTVVCIGEPSTYALSECSDNQTSPYTVQLYPGQYTTVSIATLDEYNGRAPSLLFLRNTNRIIFETLWSQAIGTNYTINSSLQNVTFELIPQAVFISALSGDTNATLISVQVLPCPLGFTFNSSNGSCECNAFLSEQQGVWCNVSNFQIDDVQIYKPSKSWLGTINGALAFHEVCSFDYCSGVTAVNLRKQDDQCATNHSGPLCRGCADGLSEMFGGSQCKKCDNLHLLLLLPFAAMGVVLVFALLTLNLTVSNGTLNGFIFYANIVKINESAFLQGSNSVLIKIISIFISWLNLDLGIVTCFYDRMSTAGRLGLQFVFPVYILVLVGLIVTAGRYSTRVSNLCRHNVVPVLATLVLLTYGKLLKTVIDILSIDYIAVAMDNNRTTVTNLYVWKYNANIIYLHSSHVPLFIMAFLTVLLFILPYAILLLLTPCIQTKSDWKILNWVNKLKPFIDSYEGPYIGRHRFWSGLLLLIRIPIYVSSALVEITNSSFNLSVAMFFIAAVVIYLARFNVYKNVKYCYLEMFLYINLIGLCLFPLLYRSRVGYDQDANSTQSLSELHFSYITFVGSVFIVFVAVIVLQEYHQIRKAKGKYTTVPKLTFPELTDPESDASSSHTVALSHENEKESDTGYREELLDD
eukprot:Em0006g1497a